MNMSRYLRTHLKWVAPEACGEPAMDAVQCGTIDRGLNERGTEVVATLYCCLSDRFVQSRRETARAVTSQQMIRKLCTFGMYFLILMIHRKFSGLFSISLLIVQFWSLEEFQEIKMQDYLTITYYGP